MSGADHAFMARALALAQAQLGRTAPNPAVGCVIVQAGAVAAEAATGDGGRPHAEETALAAAGVRAEGADVFVTLEPCNARSAGGRSCTDLLLAARPARVLFAAPDPHPNAAGEGPRRLRAAGIEVIDGLGAGAAGALYAGFVHRVRTGLPLIEIADGGARFEAELSLGPDETLAAALARLGAHGISLAFARPGTAAAAAVQAAAEMAGWSLDGPVSIAPSTRS